ncbi:DUF308 domain-containing protein [Oerskovia sp. M15]
MRATFRERGPDALRTTAGGPSRTVDTMTEQDESLTGRTTKFARRLWGLAYLRGLLFLVVGVVLFVEPDRGIRWLTWLVAAMAAVQGSSSSSRPDASAGTAREPSGGGSSVAWVSRSASRSRSGPRPA